MKENRLQKINEIWAIDPNRGIHGTERSVTFNELASSIVSLGPFYYYVIDFSDGSLKNHSDSFAQILGLDPQNSKFGDILEAIHPDDFELVGKLEAACGEFFFRHIAPEKLMRYKSSFNFRMRLKSGEYALFNHQALMLSLSDDGGYGTAINIHTRIDHLTETNNNRFSAIGLDGEPSFLNISLDADKNHLQFSNKEIEVIRNLSEGLDSSEIADKLFISPHTVKTHRRNILQKSGCKNVAQLIKMCVMQGLI
ncbi:LuxR C-terminal-related transcriptional regulator [Flavobacterium sp.]|uniref:helix-turn-helix transcriptional regulator n=1 Tax=Flavobacterium sp. TaxID=239 RepID=UPI00120FE759|nr:LuxR C-terminal-related transcriptional regulator [Flavobacterium sp.]RZJ72179.1 MAG: helix-turn-helix transcriptional regulator [Flavobacterium sp.]